MLAIASNKLAMWFWHNQPEQNRFQSTKSHCSHWPSFQPSGDIFLERSISVLAHPGYCETKNPRDPNSKVGVARILLFTALDRRRPLELEAQRHRKDAPPAIVLLEVVEQAVFHANTVRDTEDRMVERIDHLQAVLQISGLGNLEGLEYAEVHRLDPVAMLSVA